MTHDNNNSHRHNHKNHKQSIKGNNIKKKQKKTAETGTNLFLHHSGSFDQQVGGNSHQNNDHRFLGCVCEEAMQAGSNE